MAIVAAIAASAADDGDQPSHNQPRKSELEDDCMEQLQYRIRDEHHHAARVSLQKTWLEQENLVGEATVRYDHSGRRASFTCHFDIRWRPPDSSYYLYTDEGRR